jgi:hypothetical protein
MAAPQVIWDILRNNDSFLVRKTGVTFSRDPKNLTNIHSYAASGLAQPKAVGVQLVAAKTKAGKATSRIVLTQTTKKVRTRLSACAGRRAVGHWP